MHLYAQMYSQLLQQQSSARQATVITVYLVQNKLFCPGNAFICLCFATALFTCVRSVG